jgi:dienelactone hydrolase
MRHIFAGSSLILSPLIALGISLSACKSQPAITSNSSANTATATAATGNSVRRISFDTPDGNRIVGSYYPVEQKNAPAVLMLHQWKGTRADFEPLAREFQSKGIAVLTIDGRGFGESTKPTDGPAQPSRTAEATRGMLSDVSGATAFLSGQQGLDRSRIGIVGASYGSSLAIMDAAADPAIKAVALVSPGLNYQASMATEPAVKSYGARPLLIVAAEDDTDSASASRLLDSVAAGDKHQLKIYARGGHGNGLLHSDVGLDQLLLDFFVKNL